MYKSGVSARKIAESCDFSHQTISQRLKESGIHVSASVSISAAKKGKPSNQLGLKRSHETIEKMRRARIGIAVTRGHKFTDEQRANMRAARLRYIEKNPEKFRRDLAKAREALPRLGAEEKMGRSRSRNAMKMMLRRILTMTRKRKDRKTEDTLGYTKDQLRAHLESRFSSGMTWEDRDSFHIDHIIPVAWFLEQGIFDPKVICALDNLQPLVPAENRRKSSRIDHYTNKHLIAMHHETR